MLTDDLSKPAVTAASTPLSEDREAPADGPALAEADEMGVPQHPTITIVPGIHWVVV
jgi:hypothetical protein